MIRISQIVSIKPPFSPRKLVHILSFTAKILAPYLFLLGFTTPFVSLVPIINSPFLLMPSSSAPFVFDGVQLHAPFKLKVQVGT